MICWECGKKEGTKQFQLKKLSEFSSYDDISQRWYCEKCYSKVEAVDSVRKERQKVRKANYGMLPEWYERKK